MLRIGQWRNRRACGDISWGRYKMRRVDKVAVTLVGFEHTRVKK